MPSAPQASPGRNDPCTAGNFRVEIPGIPSTSFTEVRGLEVSIDVIDYRAGDSNVNTDRKLPGSFKTSDVTLKRGVIGELSLWNWIHAVMTGNVTRQAVLITLLDQSDNPVLTWKLTNAWPCKWSGPVLNAGCSEVAMEELVLCCEGIELAVP